MERRETVTAGYNAEAICERCRLGTREENMDLLKLKHILLIIYNVKDHGYPICYKFIIDDKQKYANGNSGIISTNPTKQ